MDIAYTRLKLDKSKDFFRSYRQDIEGAPVRKKDL
jgi:hypothetical protein